MGCTLQFICGHRRKYVWNVSGNEQGKKKRPCL